MDILVPDIWLKDYIKTTATQANIAKYMSLAGPSFEKIEGVGKEAVYHIEITTNRVDTASIYGIAREALAILPRFGFKTTFKEIDTTDKIKFSSKVKYIDITLEKNLASRFTVILIEGVTLKSSPVAIQERLKLVGERPINNIVDISNYIMHDLGSPIHTFDYDKVTGAKMRVRESRNGEIVQTLDGQEYKLPGGDIVIEDGAGKIIDLAGIMGAANSKIDENTKNILLLVPIYNPTILRKTSMLLAKRTYAVNLFEKGLDPEIVNISLSKAVDLFVKITGGKPASVALDIYQDIYREKTLKVSHGLIIQKLGITISKMDIEKYLRLLGFKVKWTGSVCEIKVPSARSRDIEIPEDIVEEIARIYGYHNFPSILMEGQIPELPQDSPFEFERKIKEAAQLVGGLEIYTLSLVSKEMLLGPAIKVRNPLGTDTEYLRNSLMPSLVSAAHGNNGLRDKFHLFEVANVYLPQKGNLPDQIITFAGIFQGYSYRSAKGSFERILEILNIQYDQKPAKNNLFKEGQFLEILHNDEKVGMFGVLINGFIYYELNTQILKNAVFPKRYSSLPKFPAQIEDLTFNFPGVVYMQDVIKKVEKLDKTIKKVKYIGNYKNAYTIRVWFQSNEKTLRDQEVAKIRNKIIKEIEKKWKASLKG